MNQPGTNFHRALPALLAVALIFSGATSLALEVAWARSLRIVFGSTALSISTILVSYMLGLALGSRVGGRLSQRLRNPILVYGIVELGVGAFALVSLHGVEGISRYLQPLLVNLSFAQAGLLRFFVCGIFFLTPTLLMGMTFPLVVSAVGVTKGKIGRQFSVLYASNTAGAVMGVLTIIVVALPNLGLAGSVTSYGVVSLILGLLLLILSRQFDRVFLERESYQRRPVNFSSDIRLNPRWVVGLTICALVGFVSLAVEVIWTRNLTMVFGSSVYAFSSVLAVFLVGIALGGLTVRSRYFSVQEPWSVYLAALVALPFSIVGGFYAFGFLSALLEYTFLRVGVDSASLIYATIGGSFITLLPATIILGALFPLTFYVLKEHGKHSGVVTGRIYFWNTLGASVGAFVAAHVMIPSMDTETSVAILCLVPLATATMALLVVRTQMSWQGRSVTIGALGILGVFLFNLPTIDRSLLTAGLFYNPPSMVEIGLPRLPIPGEQPIEIVFYEEGVNGTVSVHRTPTSLDLRINGKTDASTGDMNTQILLGQVPLVLAKSPESVMVIGMGSGVTAGSVTTHHPKSLEIVELEPAVLRGSRLFEQYNYRPLEYPGTVVIKDDARIYLATSKSAYDVIISEPSNPWVSGAANLFTREFFSAVEKRLQPSGLFMQWVQLYGMTNQQLLAIINSLSAEFQFIYGFRASPDDADLLLLAANRLVVLPNQQDWNDIRPEVRRDLNRIGVASLADFLSFMVLNPSDIRQMVSGVTITNTDDNLFVELTMPWNLYNETDEVFDLLNEHSHSWTSIEGAELGASLLSEVALSNVWLRQDLSMAKLLGNKALGIERTATGLVAALEWRQAIGESSGENIEELQAAAIRMEPHNAFALFSHAKLQLENGDLLAASGNIEAAIRIQPDNPNFRQLRLSVMAARTEWEEAEAELKWLQESNVYDFNPIGLGLAAEIYSNLGQTELAVDYLQQYLQHNLDLWENWELLESKLIELGRMDEAAAAREKLKVARHNSAVELHRRSRTLVQEGNTEAAIAILTNIDRTFPEYTRFLEPDLTLLGAT